MFEFSSAKNKRHKIILIRWAWSCVLYSIFYILGIYACLTGLIGVSLQHFSTVYFIIFVFQVLFYKLVKSGYYERWNEATFVYLEIMVGITTLVYFMFWVDDLVRSSLAYVSILGLLYGIFAIHRRHFLTLAIYPTSFYIALNTRDIVLGINKLSLEIFLFQTIIIFFVIVFFAYIANNIAKKRKKLNSNRALLKRQTSELEDINKELISSLEDMSEKAVKDELTGLYNRHQFNEVLEAQLQVADNFHNPLGFLIMDVDHFKQVNDNYGHQAGDLVLKSFKELQSKVLRKADFIARLGGEEFVIILPNTDQSTTLEVAERIRNYIESKQFDEIEKGFHITISIGSTIHQEDEAPQNMIERADKALYNAKENGRNQVVFLD